MQECLNVRSAFNKAAKTQFGHSNARCMILCLAVSIVTTVPVSTNVTACHMCCGTAKLWGTMTYAMTASTLCIVPLYSMMISVVSVFLSSLTDILAPALNPACSSVSNGISVEAAAAVCFLLVYNMVSASKLSNILSGECTTKVVTNLTYDTGLSMAIAQA